MKYFAYGSNMNKEQMKERCPDSTLISKAVLKNYCIAFTIFSPIRKCGCADVRNSPGSEVWGLLYEISENDLKNLDEAEVHPYKYYRFTATVEDDQEKKYQAEVYKVATKEADFLKPSRHYLGLMLDAARNFNFPDAYQRILIQVETVD